MTRSLNILLFLFIMALVSCEEEFWPNLNKYEEVLVVDGFISDAPGPYEVKLSNSSNVRYPEFKPNTGAQIIISDNLGNFEELTEVEAGSYMTSVDGFQGIAGRKYQIRIKTLAGQTYESSFQTLNKAVGIDTVYHTFESRSTSDPETFLYGYQFYVDSEEAETDSVYFLWRATETYKFNSDFKIRFVFNGYLAPFTNSDSLFTCWATDQPNQIFTLSTLGLSKPQVAGFPLNFVDTETRKLSIRYSLLVSQLSIDQKAYGFYTSLGDMNNEQDLLYTQQPYQVRGNVVNVTDDQEPVLGYFLVAGKSEKRIFVDAPSVVYFNYEECNIGEAAYKAYAEDLWGSDPILWPIYIVVGEGGGRAWTPQECVDCTQKGGTLNKPDFWVD